MDLSGGQDKSIRLMTQFRALNLPAIRETRGILFDETAAEASTVIMGIDGVLLPPYDLYLHRNIGFSTDDYQADIDDLVRRFSFPERCRVERIAPGFVRWRERKHPDYSVPYSFWERNANLNEVRPRPWNGLIPNLVYACD